MSLINTMLYDLRAGLAERSARRHLRQLHEQIGRPGLRAAAAEPALAAAIDQHAAAVRDIVGEARPSRCCSLSALSTLPETPTAAPVAGRCVRLSAYARSLLDEHRCSAPGRPQPPDTRYPRDWISLRLVAVCLLAESLC